MRRGGWALWRPRGQCVCDVVVHPPPCSEARALCLKPRIRFKLGFEAWRDLPMDLQQEVLRVLDEVLSLDGRSAAFARDTPLLGAIPELDSMAVVSLITAFEDSFGIAIDDDDIDGDTFATVGALVDFLASKTAA